MNVVLSVLLLIAGFILLVRGADWLVEGSSALARAMGMSELMIGLTIVAFGTSMPELLVNIIASAQGSTDIAIGNIVGSNISNTFLVLGAAAAIAPLYVKESTTWKEIPFSLLATIILFIMLNDAWIDADQTNMLSRSEGFTLIGFFLIFLYYTFGIEPEEEQEHEQRTLSLLQACTYVLLGCIMLPIGGKFVVDGGSSIALFLGVSEALIGLSLVALGTSLPEVVTACVAVKKGKIDIAVGNVVGSNIFNILWILGISAIIRPLAFNPSMNTDVLIALFASMLILFFVHKGPVYHRVFIFWKRREQAHIMKHEGILLLIGYVAYLVYIGWRG